MCSHVHAFDFPTQGPRPARGERLTVHLHAQRLLEPRPRNQRPVAQLLVGDLHEHRQAQLPRPRHQLVDGNAVAAQLVGTVPEIGGVDVVVDRLWRELERTMPGRALIGIQDWTFEGEKGDAAGRRFLHLNCPDPSPARPLSPRYLLTALRRLPVLLRRLREQHRRLPVIVLQPGGTATDRSVAYEMGADAVCDPRADARELRAQVLHHLLDLRDPHQSFSLAEYVQLARLAITDIQARGNTPMLKRWKEWLWSRQSAQPDALSYALMFRLYLERGRTDWCQKLADKMALDHVTLDGVLSLNYLLPDQVLQLRRLL